MPAVVDPSTLDFRAPSADLPGALGPPETIEAPSGAELAVWAGGACLVEGGRCLQIAPGFRQWLDDVAGLSASLCGPPLLHRSDGSVTLLDATLTDLPDAPADTDQLIGLDTEDSFWAAREVGPVTWVSEAGHCLWQRPEPPARVLPVGTIMVCQPARAPTTLQGVAIRTGEVLWTAELPLPGALLAAVDTTVWVALPAGRIVGLSVDSGAPCAEISTPAFVPTGAVSADAVLHLVTPMGWTGIDLSAGGATRFHIDTSCGCEGAATISQSGDLVAADHDGFVWRLSTARPAIPEKLLDTHNEVVKRIAITMQGLLVLTRERLHVRWAERS